MAIRIFVDQGHNPYGFNAGAEGFGLREQDITYIIGVYLVDILQADPRFEAIVSRQNPNEIIGYNTTSGLRERVDMANVWNADCFISIHVNANDNPDINGTEAYVYAENTPAYHLGKHLVEEVTKKVGTHQNNVHSNPSFFVLKKAKMPAVLLELAYITNYEDSILLSNATYQFAYAIYTGLLNHFGYS